MLWFYVLSIHVWWLRLELFALIEVGGRDWDGKGTTCDEGCDCVFSGRNEHESSHAGMEFVIQKPSVSQMAKSSVTFLPMRLFHGVLTVSRNDYLARCTK